MDNNEDNEYGDEGQNLQFLPADHPLLKKLQENFTNQLTNEHERVDLELIENEENLKKIEREKEDIGVKLYGVQQQLAENQMTFEQTHENYNLVQKLRVDDEEKLANLNELYNSKKKEIDELVKKYLKSQDELSKLNRTLRQLMDYCEDMKSAILKIRRTTLRAEENVVTLEKQKKKQDFLIDSMNEAIKRLTEQKTILTAQLISQKEETEQAQQILKEAHLEMQKIIASKKNLLERWQKSLFDMQRRDNALQAIKEALKSQQEQNIELGTELMGINNEIKKEAETADNLLATNQKYENLKKFHENERKKLEHEKSRLDAQIQLLSQSLATTEAETKKVDIEKKNIEEEMIQIEQNIMKLHSETKKLIEDLLHNISEHKTIEKTAANLQKQAHVIAGEVEEKEVELENLLNEIARVQIDKLNTTSQIEMLENKKKEVLKTQEEKKITVATYELQIRQGHDLNEKKQHEVGRLNKMHDELQSASVDTTRGPLEAVKSQLKRQIQEKKDTCELLQRDWIKKQTTLVNERNDLNSLQEEVSQQRTKQTILEQKKLRLNQNYNQHTKEINEVENSLKNLQTEMNRLNDKLAQNYDKKMKLENENYNIESEFIEKLKEMEKEAVRYEVQNDKLKEEKADLLAEIIESERQILLWERKIVLEKEMQETLNPNVGQKEIEDLKKDIHRMELRLEELRKKQEQIIGEMERSVYKREAIQLKYINKDTKGKNANKQGNSGSVLKQISGLKQTLNSSTNSVRQIENQLKQKSAELQNLSGQLEDQIQKQSYLENEVHNNSMQLHHAKIIKLLNILEISTMQTEAKALEQIATNKVRVSYSPAQLQQKNLEQDQMINDLKSSLKAVLDEYPHYAFLIEPLMQI